MSWPLDDIYPLDNSPQHDWGVRPATDGFIFHTTEGAGPSRADAIATAKWQQSNPGSYNFIIYDGGLLSTIPPRHACGGINPASEWWHPENWLQALLPDRAFADPTMFHIQAAFSGKAARLSAGAYPQNMIDTAARLIRWVERQDWGANNLIVSGHVHWQDNRTDPGAGVLDRILERYEQMVDQVPGSSGDAMVDCQLDLAEARDRIRRLRARAISAEQKLERVRGILADDPPGS